MVDIYPSVFICFLTWELLNCGTGPKLFATPLGSPRELFLSVGDSECGQGWSSDVSGLFPVAGWVCLGSLQLDRPPRSPSPVTSPAGLSDYCPAREVGLGLPVDWAALGTHGETNPLPHPPILPPFPPDPSPASAASLVFGILCVFKAWDQLWFYPESQKLLVCEDGILWAEKTAARGCWLRPGRLHQRREPPL